MESAKDLRVAPIRAADANRLVQRLHYSGKVAPNSQLHFGVFYRGHLEGVMQLGPSINKKGTMQIVQDTKWNGFIELNRMAFSERLPRNSESRALSVAMKLMRKHYSHIEWIVSFADGTQCGDGAIYRASGFLLTDIRLSDALRVNPKSGETMHVIQAHHLKLSKEFRAWKSLDGFQMRYVYFLNPAARQRLTVPVLPFAAIDAAGARMYRGQRVTGADSGTAAIHAAGGGANPTVMLGDAEA
ncbi:MAG: hypothetical protein ACO248_00805 [Burkholderiaceae bacterium]